MKWYQTEIDESADAAIDRASRMDVLEANRGMLKLCLAIAIQCGAHQGKLVKLLDSSFQSESDYEEDEPYESPIDKILRSKLLNKLKGKKSSITDEDMQKVCDEEFNDEREDVEWHPSDEVPEEFMLLIIIYSLDGVKCCEGSYGVGFYRKHNFESIYSVNGRMKVVERPFIKKWAYLHELVSHCDN